MPNSYHRSTSAHIFHSITVPHPTLSNLYSWFQANLNSLDLLDLKDVAAHVGCNLLLDERSIAGIWAVEDVVDFL